MGVPPARSSTDAATFASATSTSRCFRCRVMFVSRVPNTSVWTRWRSSVIAGTRCSSIRA
jgi:hypothetical protein